MIVKPFSRRWGKGKRTASELERCKGQFGIGGRAMIPSDRPGQVHCMQIMIDMDAPSSSLLVAGQVFASAEHKKKHGKRRHFRSSQHEFGEQHFCHAKCEYAGTGSTQAPQEHFRSTSLQTPPFPLLLRRTYIAVLVVGVGGAR